MSIAFEHPAWLWLLLLAIPATMVGFRWFTAMSRARRWAAVALRVALIALVTAMLAGMSSVRRSDQVAVIGVLDVSGSVRLFGSPVRTNEEGEAATDPIGAARAFLKQAMAGRGPDDLAGLVVFDGKAWAVAAPTRAGIMDRAIEPPGADGTDIAAALRHAAALAPPGAAARLVLFSDGAQTAGDALGAARELAGSPTRPPVRVDVVPLKLASSNEVLIESVDAPPRAAAGATVTVRITLLASVPTAGELTLMHNGEVLDIAPDRQGFARRLELGAGRHVELVSVPLPPGRVHQFRAVFQPEMVPGEGGAQRARGDTRPENNAGEAFTYSGGRGSVLLVDGVGGGGSGGGGAGGTLASVLREGGIDVTVVPPEGLPDNLLALQAYDLVLLNNVPAEAVPERTQRALEAHVREMGAGLVMIGGPDSLGAGGWKGSVIEPMLPVLLDLPERLVQPDAAIVFVMDNSGSMGRPVLGSMSTQQEIANQSAALAVKTLSKTDLIGVVVFNSETRVLVPLAPNTDPKRTAERILSVAPGGGTRLGPALEEARRQLAPVKAAAKHVIVLSDGRSMDSEMLPVMSRQMHEEDGITISAITVGDAADDETMSRMAAQGGGRFYAVNNPTLLPRFFMQAVRVVRTPLIREGVIEPVLRPEASPLTAGLGVGGAGGGGRPPELLGMVLTQRRPEPTIWYPMEAATGEPLLAHWNVELGQVGVFASDARADGWARRWIGWPGYRSLWIQVARTMARASVATGLELTSEVVGDSLRLQLAATDREGRPLDLLTVPATVRTPSGKQVQAALAQTGPGLYRAELPAEESGTYVTIVTPSSGSTRLPPVIAGSSVAAGAEFRSLREDRELLERIASETGGRVLDLSSPDEADLFDRSGVRMTEARQPLWRGLLLWSLIVLLLDIACRRIAWDRFVSREYGVDLARAAQEAVAQRGEQAARAMGRLRESPRPAERSVPAGVAVLSDEDAERLAAEQADRRRQARIERLREVREAQRAGAEEIVEASGSAVRKRGGAVKEEPKQAAEESRSEGADLLAAKRRAREKFGE